jgi:inner membrane transporter RhtA
VTPGPVRRDRAIPSLVGENAVAAGALSSVVPYAADLTALRLVQQRLFGVFMGVHPVLAGLAGLVLLGQVLDLHEWAGIVLGVAANAAAVAAVRAPRPSPQRVAEPSPVGQSTSSRVAPVSRTSSS